MNEQIESGRTEARADYRATLAMLRQASPYSTWIAVAGGRAFHAFTILAELAGPDAGLLLSFLLAYAMGRARSNGSTWIESRESCRALGWTAVREQAALDRLAAAGLLRIDGAGDGRRYLTLDLDRLRRMVADHLHTHKRKAG